MKACGNHFSISILFILSILLDLWIKRLDIVEDVVHLVVRQLQEDGQGQDLLAGALGIREVTFFVPQVLEALLQMQRDGIIDRGADPPTSKISRAKFRTYPFLKKYVDTTTPHIIPMEPQIRFSPHKASIIGNAKFFEGLEKVFVMIERIQYWQA